MAKRVEEKGFEKYLSEARSWETDKSRELERSRLMAWIVAGVASLIAAIGVVTVALLTPIQRVEAYVVRVDSVTGKATVLKPMDSGDMTHEEAVNKYFVQWYVRWREGYLKPVADQYYYNVGILSSQGEQASYLKQYDTANPNSPLNIYKNDGRSLITIKSTTMPAKDTAEVRFTKEEYFGNGKEKRVSQWLAVVHYMYSNASMSERDREINPLGFQVLNYMVVDETPPDRKIAAQKQPENEVSTSQRADEAAISAPPLVPALKPVTPVVMPPVNNAGAAPQSTPAANVPAAKTMP